MKQLHVLMANELRSYRETLAAALQALRPNVQVATAEPHLLESEVKRLAPQLVVCSRLSLALKNKVLSWVELYPGHESSIALVSIGGERSKVDEIEFTNLLSIIDRTEGLIKAHLPHMR